MPRGTLDTSLSLHISHTGLLPSMVSAFQLLILLCSENHYASPQPQDILLSLGLGSSAFARHYLRNLFCFLFLWVLRCFSSQRLPRYTIYSCNDDLSIYLRSGFPIRISTGQWLFAPLRSFSQLITSFIGFWCQGIHPMLLVA